MRWKKNDKNESRTVRVKTFRIKLNFIKQKENFNR